MDQFGVGHDPFAMRDSITDGKHEDQAKGEDGPQAQEGDHPNFGPVRPELEEKPREPPLSAGPAVV